MNAILIAKLSISFDRGAETNRPADLGLDKAVTETPAGGLVRGLGTHYRSAEAKAYAKECGDEEGRLRRAFDRTFGRAPFAGTYLVTDREAPRRLLAESAVDPRLAVSLSFFDLKPAGPLPQSEVDAWAKRVHEQLKAAPLGYKDEASAEGLRVIERLADCPILGDETRKALHALVKDAKLATVKRLDFRRKIAELKIDLSVGPVAAPRRIRAVRPSPAAAESVA